MAQNISNSKQPQFKQQIQAQPPPPPQPRYIPPPLPPPPPPIPIPIQLPPQQPSGISSLISTFIWCCCCCSLSILIYLSLTVVSNKNAEEEDIEDLSIYNDLDQDDFVLRNDRLKDLFSNNDDLDECEEDDYDCLINKLEDEVSDDEEGDYDDY